MTTALHLNEDRLFPADPAARAIARRLHAAVRMLYCQGVDLRELAVHSRRRRSEVDSRQAWRTFGYRADLAYRLPKRAYKLQS